MMVTKDESYPMCFRSVWHDRVCGYIVYRVNARRSLEEKKIFTRIHLLTN